MSSFHFNNHWQLTGKHAFLSASQYHWIRYTDEKFDTHVLTSQLAALGSRKHDFAKNAIELGIKLPRNTKTMNAFVNDAIGFRMKPEQILYYSDNCFGTADAVSFDGKILRIHDLKTGVTKASMDQLLVYTAMFCLEYDVRPGEIDIELRIYQNDEVLVEIPDLDAIVHIMDRIKFLDRRLEEMKAKGGPV